MSAFVVELRQLLENCEFDGILDDMLRDRLVCGINNAAMQHRLLGEATLPFRKAFAMETAANSTKNTQQTNGNVLPGAVYHIFKEKKGKATAMSVECYRCGGAHVASDCSKMQCATTDRKRGT